MRAAGREGVQGGRPPAVGPGRGGGPARAQADVDAGPGGGLAPDAEGTVPLDDHVIAERGTELNFGGRGAGGERQDQGDGRSGAVAITHCRPFGKRMSRPPVISPRTTAVLSTPPPPASASPRGAGRTAP